MIFIMIKKSQDIEKIKIEKKFQNIEKKNSFNFKKNHKRSQ